MGALFPLAHDADAALLAREPEVTALRAVVDDLLHRRVAASRPGFNPHRRAASEAAHDAASALMRDVWLEVAAARAVTMRGLRFKASITESGALPHDRAAQALVLSIVADVMAMDPAAAG